MEARSNSVTTYAIALLLIALGAGARLLPHEANFAPIAAIALFGGVYLKPRHALLVPLLALVLSDIALGFDSIQSRMVVYTAFMAIGVIGLLVRRRKNLLTIISGTLAGSVLFYAVTNLVWLYPATMYSHDIAGQVASYYNALPFFRATLLGDLFYAGILFGGFELATLLIRKHQLRKERENYMLSTSKYS